MQITTGQGAVLQNYNHFMTDNLLTILNLKHYAPSTLISLKNEIFSQHLDSIFQHNHQFICAQQSHNFTDYYLFINLVLLNATISNILLNFINNCRKTQIRFIIIPLIILTQYNADGNSDSHSNILIIDNLLHTIEFFEPHGKEYKLGNYDLDIEETIKIILNELFTEEFVLYNFINLQNQCPIGLQAKQSYVDIYAGHCQAWSLLIIELRLLNFLTSTEDIIEFLHNQDPYDLDLYIKKYITYVYSKTSHKTPKVFDYTLIYNSTFIHFPLLLKTPTIQLV